MSPISIWKKVNQHQPVMKPDRDLVSAVSIIFYPVIGIAEQCGQHFSHLLNLNPNGFFSLAIDSRPFPRLIKHPAVEFSDVFI